MLETEQRVRVAVLSAKGGCGRSTVAINLAYLLASAGRRVAIVDLAQFGSLGFLLQVPHRPGTGLGPVATCLASGQACQLPEFLEGALVTCRLGNCEVSLLPAAPPQRQDDLTVDEILRVLRTLSDSGYDLVIDTSHDISDRLAGAMLAATHHLWVLSCDPAAGWHTLQTLELARQLSIPRVPAGVLPNRYHRRCGLHVPDLESALQLPVWGVLPDLPGKLPLAGHTGIPLLAHRSGPWQRILARVVNQLGIAYRPSLLPWLRRRRGPHGQV